MAPNKNKKSNRKSNKKLFLAIGIIAIILIGVGAYEVLGQSNQPANLSPTPTPTLLQPPLLEHLHHLQLPQHRQRLMLPYQVEQRFSSNQCRKHNYSSCETINPHNRQFHQHRQYGWYDSTTFHRVIAGFMIQGGGISQTIPTI